MADDLCTDWIDVACPWCGAMELGEHDTFSDEMDNGLSVVCRDCGFHVGGPDEESVRTAMRGAIATAALSIVQIEAIRIALRRVGCDESFADVLIRQRRLLAGRKGSSRG